MPLFTLGLQTFINTFRKPATLPYPAQKRVLGSRVRGAININIDECIFCGACDRRCPSDAITVNKGEKLWSIDRMRCISCSFCTEVCPKKCLHTNSTYSGPYRADEKETAREMQSGA